MAEAVVLDAGTVIFSPDMSSSTTLSEVHFLLDRQDMEQATQALENVKILTGQINQLEALSMKQASEIVSARFWTGFFVVTTIALPVVVFILEEARHAIR
jgi:ABC-type phosphate/phosphonate transport system ATPase subunit